MSDFEVKKIEMNSRGVIALLQSDEVMNMLLTEAEKIGTIESNFVGFDRCHVMIKEE